MNGRDNGGARPGPENLLGGYATGSLSAEEQKLLFEAALKDEALFEQLMKEQALKETLEQPGVRRELIESLAAPPGVAERFRKWLGSPVAWTAAGALAGTLFVVLSINRMATSPTPEVVTQNIKVAAPAAAGAPETASLPTAQQTPPAPSGRVAELERRPRTNLPAKPRAMAEVRATPEALPVAALPPPPPVEPVQQPAAAPVPAVVAEAVRAPEPPPAAPRPAAPGAADMAVAERASERMAKTAATAQPRAASLDYGFLRAGADGIFRPVASAGELAPGDRFKITVTSTADGPIAVLVRHANRTATVAHRGTARAGATMLVPVEGSLAVSEVRAVVLEFGNPAPQMDARRPMTFRQRVQGAVAGAGSAPGAGPAAEPGIRIEIPIGPAR